MALPLRVVATRQDDGVGTAAAGTDVKHPIYPAAVDDRIRCAVGLDGQVTTIQDVQVSAAVGVFARSPHQGDGVPIDRGGKGRPNEGRADTVLEAAPEQFLTLAIDVTRVQ